MLLSVCGRVILCIACSSRRGSTSSLGELRCHLTHAICHRSEGFRELVTHGLLLHLHLLRFFFTWCWSCPTEGRGRLFAREKRLPESIERGFCLLRWSFACHM